MKTLRLFFFATKFPFYRLYTTITLFALRPGTAELDCNTFDLAKIHYFAAAFPTVQNIHTRTVHRFSNRVRQSVSRAILFREIVRA